jgi:GT2 family glycosyltransferase
MNPEIGRENITAPGGRVTALRERLTVVVLTHNRAGGLRHTLRQTLGLPDQPAIIVVDNASADGTARLVGDEFPGVTLLHSDRNIGAAARNLGVRHASTPYVAFCDDDSWWAEGSLEAALAVLDAHARLAAVCARILLGPEQREDPVCGLMAASPLPSQGLPGPALLGFIACAVVFRREAYLAAGGYEAHFFVGGEEALLTLHLVSLGWHVVYLHHLTVHHHPSPQRDRAERHRIVARNAIWVAWLRLPLSSAVAETWRMTRYARRHRVLRGTLGSALRELPWLLRKRQVVTRELDTWYRMLQG